MLTKKDYCDYDTCVALKELGIDCYSPYYYDNKRHLRQCGMGHYSTTNANCMGVILAIHLYDANKWLREEKGLHIELDRVRDQWQVSVVETEKNLCLAVKNRCQSYEEALLEGIKEAIKILKEGKQ